MKKKISRQWLADIIAFLSFQLPLYWLVTSLAGATVGQIARSSVSLAIMFIPMGWAYGKFLTLVRKLFA